MIAGVLLGLWLVVFCDVVSDLLGGSVLWLVQCWFLGLYVWGVFAVGVIWLLCFWVCGLVVIGFLVLRFTGCFDCCGLLFKFGVRCFWVC